MEDAVLVGKGQGAADGGHHVGALVVAEGSALHAREELGQVEAVHVLHDEVGVGPLHLKVQDAHYVGVGQKAGGAGLAQGLLGRGRTDAVVHVQDGDALDGHATLQAGVPAGAHRPEAARAPAGQHAVAVEEHLLGGLLGGAQGHRLWLLVSHGASFV